MKLNSIRAGANTMAGWLFYTVLLGLIALVVVMHLLGAA